jgi:Ca2+/H+ antiporter, TMEM165/GDT1 family
LCREERRLLQSLLAAYGIVFLAELGDKLMLMVMTMASSSPWRVVLLAAAAATAFVMAVAVLFGEVAAALLPAWAVGLGAAVLFFGFGVWTLLGAGEEAAEGELVETPRRRGGLPLFFGLAATIILAELGDKTQIAVLSLAGLNPGQQLLIWAGAFGGMFSVLGVAIIVGARLTRFVPARLVGRVAGLVFIGFGVLALVFAIGELS